MTPESMQAEIERLRAWQIDVAEGLGYLNRTDGGEVVDVADPQVIIDGCSADRARADAAEDENAAIVEGICALAVSSPNAKPSLCTWCGHAATTLEERREHNEDCAKSPAVQRALAAESALAEVTGDAEAYRRHLVKRDAQFPPLNGCVVGEESFHYKCLGVRGVRSARSPVAREEKP